MGYNPYICIVCGIVEDNGWGWEISFDVRVRIILERLGENKCPFYNENGYTKEIGCRYANTLDVCDKCFRKGKPDKFFSSYHTKEERREYWKRHCKKKQLI